MTQNLVATASTTINAPVSRVWDALTRPDAVKQYFFGTDLVTDWRVGSPIYWRGEWQGKSYEDKGVILQNKPERLLQYTHYSPLSGVSDTPENYHTVTVELVPEGNATRVMLSQDKNASEEERDHSAQNWEMVLTGLKKFVEQ